MSSTTQTRLNEKFAMVLNDLIMLMKQLGEPHREKAYQDAQSAILFHNKDIKSVADLRGIPKVGPATIEKLTEFEHTGKIEYIEKERKSPRGILTSVYGIGAKNAVKLINHGITTLQDLIENQHLLNDKQKIGLRYHSEITQRIPRDEIDVYDCIFKKILQNSYEKIPATANSHKYEIVGSYRRGAETSGDIDVIISSRTPEFFRYFVTALKHNKIIRESLTDGATTSHVITRLNPNAIARRVDFLYAPPIEYACALLYFTGSAEFNTAMRPYLKSIGYTINEHEMCHLLPNGTKGERVSTEFKTERNIFDYCHIEWREPHERISHGSLVITTAATATAKKTDDCVDCDDDIEIDYMDDEQIISVEIEDEPVESTNIIRHIETFRRKGLEHMKILPTSTVYKILATVEYAYRETDAPLMEDFEYDVLAKWFTTSGFSEELVINAITSKKKDKIPLPILMGSLDKLTLENASRLATWFNKYIGESIGSAKLDGASVEFIHLGIGSSPQEQTAFKNKYPTAIWEQGETCKLLSHCVGGMFGHDITHVYNCGVNVWARKMPTSLPPCIIRGEFIMKRANFTKFAAEYANIRNMLPGLFNARPEDVYKIANKLAICDVVSYEVMEPAGMSRANQYRWLHAHGFNVVQFIPQLFNTHNQTFDEILKILMCKFIEWKQTSEYDIDGLCVFHNDIYIHPQPDRTLIKAPNPKHGFAYKMEYTEQFGESTVVDVVYKISKDGKAKPTVIIEPFMIGGVTIRRLSAHNAKFIIDNCIAPGAKVEFKLSGDIIPTITKVPIPALEPKLPDFPFKYGASGVDIYFDKSAVEPLNDGEISEQDERCIAKFFKDLGVDGLGPGNIKRIIASGFTSVQKIINMEPADFVEYVAGFKEKMAIKVCNSIDEKLSNATLPLLMTASNAFGAGFNIKRCSQIMAAIPQAFELDHEDLLPLLLDIDGVASKTAVNFIEHIEDFREFMETIGLSDRLYAYEPTELSQQKNSNGNSNSNSNHILFGREIVITGGKSAAIVEKLEKIGAILGKSVTKATALVIAKSHDDMTTKACAARDKGIDIVTEEEFLEI